MKRKIIATAFLFILFVVGLVALSACTLLLSGYSLYYSDDRVCSYQYNFKNRDAYLENIYIRNIDDNDFNYAILDDISGIPVTGLGKGPGIADGLTVHVTIDKPEGAHSWMWSEETYPQSDGYETVFDDDCQTIVINLHLGSNISKIALDDRWYTGYYVEVDHFHTTVVIQVKVAFHFTVSENNATFFAEDGKLYFKETCELFDGFFYE